MANRQNTFLLKRSSVPGKVPSPGDIKLGEIAINTAGVILYASGTTQNQILIRIAHRSFAFTSALEEISNRQAST